MPLLLSRPVGYLFAWIGLRDGRVFEGAQQGDKTSNETNYNNLMNVKARSVTR